MIKNRTHYLNRCNELQVFLKDAETLPAHIIATQCLAVMRNIYGSKWRVALWVARIAARDSYRSVRFRVWFLWQRYFRRRTEAQVYDLINQQLEQVEEQGGDE